MSTKFMYSEKSKTSDAHKLRLNLTNKTDLRRRNNHVVLPNLSFYYTWKETNNVFCYQRDQRNLRFPTRNCESTVNTFCEFYFVFILVLT